MCPGKSPQPAKLPQSAKLPHPLKHPLPPKLPCLKLGPAWPLHLPATQNPINRVRVRVRLLELRLTYCSDAGGEFIATLVVPQFCEILSQLQIQERKNDKK